MILNGTNMYHIALVFYSILFHFSYCLNESVDSIQSTLSSKLFDENSDAINLIYNLMKSVSSKNEGISLF